MGKQFKLAIVRARHDSGVAVIADQACLDMLMTGPQSVLRYWSDTSDGHVDFLDSAMMPWVDVTIDPAATDRGSQAVAAFAALRAAFPGTDPLAGFHGALVLTHPGRIVSGAMTLNFDGGAVTVGALPTAVIPVMASDHTFICHELGHVLGADHSFGLDNNGTDWNPNDAVVQVGPEYGSPYDLMSSASFGSRWLGTGPFYSASPTFVDATPAGWPNPGAGSMGPNLARANLHRWFPEAFPPGRVAHRPFPGPGESGGVRLVPPGQPGVSLLILHPPNEPASGAGRVYVEYRDSHGWDRGLKVFGSDLARAGLVVHTLEDIAGADPRIWFRGSVVAGSVDTDLAVATKPVVITLDGYEDGDDGWADVTYSQTAERRIVIARANASDDIVGGSAIEERRTPCGDPITYGSWSTQSFCQFRVATTGFAGTGGAPPNVIWEVAGTVLTGLGGTALVPFDGASFFVEYAIDPISHELGLTSRGGEKYAAALTATAVEAGGGATAAATDTFAALGYFDGLSPDDAATLAQCLARIADEHRIPLPWRFRRPGPDPRFEVDPDAWGMQALDVIDTQLRFDAPAADALAHVVRLQLGR